MAKNTNRTKTGEILVYLRKKHNYKQYQVADLIDVKYDVYRNYETRTIPPMDVIVKLSNLYCVSCDFILGNTEEELPGHSQKLAAPSFSFSQPAFFNQPETEYDLNGLPEDVKMLVEGYLNSSDAKKQALLRLATEP